MLRQLKKNLMFALILLGWIFSGWPTILSFAQETTPTLQETTSTPEIISQETPSQPETAQEEVVEEEMPQISAPFEPPQPQLPPLKERVLQKEVRLDKKARHSCTANNFTVNISGQSQAVLELQLKGTQNDLENLEIGSLPLGIDIVFLNNADYNWRPQKGESNAVLQITNQPGSQKGNFSIPIIYQSGNSTTICQINLINF